jgi:hypothetical protein
MQARAILPLKLLTVLVLAAAAGILLATATMEAAAATRESESTCSSGRSFWLCCRSYSAEVDYAGRSRFRATCQSRGTGS